MEQKQKLLLFIVGLFLIFGTVCFALSLKLPFPEGKKYILTQGYDVFTHTGKDTYALDFAGSDCGGGYGELITAVTDGKVISIQYLKKGYGNNVLIDHGNNLISRYAHLKDILVSQNETVTQGQPIGTMGNTGAVYSQCTGSTAGTHLHFALYRKEGNKYIGVKPEPMSGYTNFVAGNWYTSDNQLAENNQSSQPQPQPQPSQPSPPAGLTGGNDSLSLLSNYVLSKRS